MAIGDKVTLPIQPSNVVDNNDELKKKLLNEFGQNAYDIVISLTEKSEKRKSTLEYPEDFLIQEKERNLELQKFLDAINEEVENQIKAKTCFNQTCQVWKFNTRN